MNQYSADTIDFDEFVKRQQPSPEADQLDWAAERDSWLSHLDSLYRQTESFLADYIQAGQIKFSYEKKELNEENIGSYTARQMTLKIGRQQIVLEPIGTLLISAKGRVDMVGPAGRIRLVLVDRELSGPTTKVNASVGLPKAHAVQPVSQKIDWSWKIATSPPTIRYIELTKDSLFQALMEVGNG